jgi:hypothetical protein
MPTRGSQPNRRRRGQAPNDVLANENEAAADEANPGHDLRRDTRGIEHDTPGLENVGETVFGDQHHQRRREADQRVGAKACALLPDLAFKSD